MQYNRVFRTLAFALIFSLLAAIPATPALAAAAITLTPTSGSVGTTVTVSGTEFTAGNTYQVTFASGTTFAQVVASGTVSGTTFSATFNVPSVPRGTYTIQVVTTPQTFSPTFAVTPKVTLSPSSGCVGGTVTVDGTGFKASSSVTIYFDTTSVNTVTADANGSFSGATFTVPESCGGTHTVKGKDADGDSPTVNFTISQKITIAPTSGGAGITVTVTGTGFSTSKPVTIKYNAAAVTTTPASVNTNATGNFTASFTVPASLTGTYAVEASDGTYSASTNYTMAINITLSTITSATSPGHVGMSITISGTGFQPTSQINITYTSVPIVVATTTSDYQGAFSATFKIPKSEHGAHTITASDGTNTLQAAFMMESTAPATPKLLLPPSDEKAKSRAFLDWENVTKDVTNAEEPSTLVIYDLQIASDADFTNIVLEKTELTTSGYTLLKGETLKSTKKEAPYYWRVRAVDAASNTGDWTSSRTFHVGSNWGLYCLIGAGVLLAFFLGFWAGRKSKSSEYY